MKKATERLLVYVFAGAMLVGLLAVALVLPEPTQFQYTIIRIVLALACGMMGTFITGFLKVSWGGVKAGGALGLFTIVYFFSPADLVTQVAPAAAVEIDDAVLGKLGDQRTIEVRFRLSDAQPGSKLLLDLDDESSFTDAVREVIGDPAAGRHVRTLPFAATPVYVRLTVEGRNGGKLISKTRTVQ